MSGRSNRKQIKWKDWLKTKGLDPDEGRNSEYLPDYLKETGLSPKSVGEGKLKKPTTEIEINLSCHKDGRIFVLILAKL